MLEIPGSIAGYRLIQWTVAWDMSLIMISAGAIIGIRVAWSMLLSGLFNYQKAEEENCGDNGPSKG